MRFMNSLIKAVRVRGACVCVGTRALPALSDGASQSQTDPVKKEDSFCISMNIPVILHFVKHTLLKTIFDVCQIVK